MSKGRFKITTMFDAYLDIETTGLSWVDASITVIGMYLVNGSQSNLVQLVGREVTVDNLLEAVDGVQTIYTYNGSRFDLPFIHGSLCINLADIFHHHDLMYDCWRYNLKGGFKAVEQQLSIPRKLRGITGLDAVFLWHRYQNYGDQRALATLLKYNKEDVVNLKVLREKLIGVRRPGYKRKRCLTGDKMMKWLGKHPNLKFFLLFLLLQIIGFPILWALGNYAPMWSFWLVFGIGVIIYGGLYNYILEWKGRNWNFGWFMLWLTGWIGIIILLLMGKKECRH